ncbi:TetR/AcrR family transcriptional regulator [Streptomonospora sp. PA3]|uniref:TetR/AcrR family transcriptional regulator n=1 Tax=Streptomonospora sp. PA3 TaxID=2607326 RepID=UPI0012DF03D3|nr:TetR/AcrR family transcriptional regulator [Streptomonospora sp. PA3]MUL43425.1 TetR/AcrR family transcriptional regulator [Streptomonospora sp. PA3]
MATQRGGGDGGDGRSEIERHLELLWRVAERPRRGPRPGLTVEEIVSAAVGVADADGLGAVSMQRVAAELGYTTMSLYRYVQSKEQLVELMADAAVGPPPDIGEAAGWRDRVELLSRALVECNRRRPWLLRVEIVGPPSGPMQLAWFEAYLEALAECGLAGYERVAVTLFINGAVRELARIAVQIEQARRAGGVSDESAGAAYAAALRRFAVPERFPNVAALVAEGVFDPEPADGGPVAAPDGADWGLVDEIGADITFGLRRLLDGVESYAREREHQAGTA